ncbi:MAG: penicillin-binding protein activator, partial [Rickettsiales bacterium]|nr:penicillin-binding protein activator [Rickettsiales bacterium]
VGNAMLDAATMAISDSYLTVPSDQIHSQVILMPKDTGNTPADSAKAAKQALDQGASFMIGPLFSQSVRVVSPMLQEKGINMLTFSNNRAVAGGGVYLFGFLPEEQVVRMAEYAYLHNFERVALLAPNDSYGEKVKQTLVDSYSRKGGVVAPAELYAPSPANIDAAVTRLSAAYTNTPEDKRFQAIYIADGGNQLKNIIISLKRSKIDLTKIKLLGTGLWDDPEVAQMPEMEGAWFPGSPPDSYQVFERRFVSTYGYKPVRLASLAYDAVTLVATISMANPGAAVTPEALTAPGGYISPANGLFRLNADGTSQRMLAILEVSGGQFKVIDPALRNF